MPSEDPVDDVIDAIGTYLTVPLPESRDAARAALRRWVRREIRANVLDGEGYAR